MVDGPTLHLLMILGCDADLFRMISIASDGVLTTSPPVATQCTSTEDALPSGVGCY
jgi:hypothetical protein